MDYDKIDEIHSDTIETLHYLGSFSRIQYKKRCDTWPGQLFIGDIYTSRNYFLLRALNIDTVINVTDDSDVPEFADRLNYFQLHVDDNEVDDDTLLSTMQETEILEKIRDGLYLGNVLVHCHAGVSRSATVVLCYIMVYDKQTFESAVAMIRGSRDKVFNYGTNFVFQKTIAHYAGKSK